MAKVSTRRRGVASKSTATLTDNSSNATSLQTTPRNSISTLMCALLVFITVCMGVKFIQSGNLNVINIPRTAQSKPVVHDKGRTLRQLIQQQQWGDISSFASTNGVSKAENGLVQMAVAIRAYGEVSKELGELCTGCLDNGAQGTTFLAALEVLASISTNQDLGTSLFAAVRARDLEAIRLLLRAGANPNSTFSATDGTTPLHLAVTTSSELGALSKILLKPTQVGANFKRWLDAIDPAYTSNLKLPHDVVQLADVRPIINKWTARFVQVLLDAGANVAATDALNRTPLHVAAAVGNVESVELLITAAHKVNTLNMWNTMEVINAVDVSGQTALNLAMLGEFEPVMELLNSHKAAVDHKRLDIIHTFQHRVADPTTDITTINTDTGGWYNGDEIKHQQQHEHLELGSVVNVDVHTNITAQQFFFYYFVERRPVLIKAHAAHWKLRKLLKKNAFMKRFGSRSLPTSVIPYGDHYGISKDLVLGTLGEYINHMNKTSFKCRHTRNKLVSNDDDHDNDNTHDDNNNNNNNNNNNHNKHNTDNIDKNDNTDKNDDENDGNVDNHHDTNNNDNDNDSYNNNNINNNNDDDDDDDNSGCAEPPRYIFERDVDNILPELVKAVPTMPGFLPPGGNAQILPQSPQFYLGPPRSGAPVHFHGDAWNALMFGRKIWSLYPPNNGKFSKIPISNTHADQKHRVFRVVQESGDVLFVPKGWSHGVFNEVFSIGVAREFGSIFARY